MSKGKSFSAGIIKGSFIVLLFTFFGSIFAYFIRILYSHSLSIEDYGLFYAVLGLFNLITTYSDLGFGYSIVYLIPKYLKSKNYSAAWNVFVHGQVVSFSMSIIISLLLIALAPFLAKNYFRIPGSETLIYIFCLYLISYTILNSLIQVFSGMQKEKYYSSITITRWFLTLVFSVLFILSGFTNIIFFALALTLGHLLTALFYSYLFFLNHSFLTKHKIILERKVFKKMFIFALPSLMESFVYSVVGATDVFLLTLFKGIRDVGVYNVIYPLASIPIVLFNPINGLVLPLISHLMEGEKEKLKYLIEKILEVVPFVSLYFALFIMLYPSSIVELIFGQKWLGLVEVPMRVLSFGAIGILMSGILGAITLGMGKVRKKLKVAAITAVISGIFNVIFIWYFGILGAVFTVSFFAFILSILFIRIIRESISFRIPYLFYVKLLSLSALLFIIVRFTGFIPHNWFQFILSGIVYTLIFITFGLILKVFDKELLGLINLKKK